MCDRPTMILAAARYAISELDGREMIRLADTALRAGVVHPSVTVLGTLTDATTAEAGPLFLEWLAAEGIPLPDRARALTTILGYGLRRIAEREVAPLEGLQEALRDFLLSEDATAENGGWAFGLQDLVGAYYEYEDWLEQRYEFTYAGLSGDKAQAAYGEDVIVMARDWCSQYAGEPPDGSDAATPSEGDRRETE